MDPIGATPQVGEALQTTLDLVLSFGADFFAFLVLTGVIAAFAFYFGRDRLVPLIAGLFAAVPLYTYFPYMALIGSNPWFHLGLFIALALVGMVTFLGLASWVPTSGIGMIKVLGLSAIAAGIMLAIGINMLPLSEVYTISPATAALFQSGYLFWWLVAGVAGVFLLGK